MASDAGVAAGSPATESAVDIIIDNYNYGRFVADAVDSALAQTYAKVNVIVVDDGSTDESREILQAYQSRVDLVLKENGGQASALNAGFARSQGDIVIFLDADDVLRPDAAALVASAFDADSRIVEVQYRMEVIDKDGRPTGLVKPPRHLPLPDGDLRDAELVFPFDLSWARTNAYRAQALHRILPIPERDFAACPDWYLVHLVPLLGPVAALQEVGAYYRVHGDNSYEPLEPTVDLAHTRQTIAYSAVTARALERLADDLGLERPAGPILSVSDLFNRLVSLKLEPARHPIPGDRQWRLVLDGIRAAARRFDVSWPMKLLYVGWFGIMAAAPRPLARRFAELFFFPQRRGALNRVLRRFHKWNRDPSQVVA
jgi:glycosyltransferase involved in cell wall biosynthesis